MSAVALLQQRSRRWRMLRIVAKTSGGEIGPGWNLIVLHHTDCGINCLVHSPDLLAKYFGVAPAELDALAITDPYKSVVVDVAAVKANPLLPGEFLVTGPCLRRCHWTDRDSCPARSVASRK